VNQKTAQGYAEKFDIPYFYAWLLVQTGCKQPWTWSVRDFYQKWPIAIILITVGIVVFICTKFKDQWPLFIVGLLLGLFMGHLWW